MCGYRLNIMKRLLLLVVLIVLAACRAATPNDSGSRASNEGGAWTRLPKSPLSARYASHLVAIEGKLYVIGGTAADPCPPNASCIGPTQASFSDGAAYDPETQSWTTIADAPDPIGQGSSAVIDGVLYLLVHEYLATEEVTHSSFLAYDPSRDAWNQLSLPRKPLHRQLVSTGPKVVAFQGSQENGVEGDFAYDPATDTWSELPLDPLHESFDRWMVWTDEGFVLTGLENVPQPGSEGPALYRAALLANGKWTAFGESEIFGYNPEWSWTGGTVLNSSNERGDGGETNNWGKNYNAGGTFDPATGEWGLLPNPPHGRGEFEGFSAAGERYAIAYSGWVYDAIDQRWLHLTRPDDGPEVDVGAAWLGDDLYVFGGVRWDDSEAVILEDAWMWSPGGYD